MSRVRTRSRAALTRGWGPLSPPIVSSDIVVIVSLQPPLCGYIHGVVQGVKLQSGKGFICTTIHIAISILRFLMMTERRCLNGIARSS